MAEENATGEVTENLAGTASFTVEASAPDPMRPSIEPKPAPEGIPEKFWDADKGEVRLAEMAKSYAELEAKFSAPKEETEAATEESEETSEEVTEESTEESTEETTEETSEEEESSEETSEASLADAMTAAQTAYAETGELSAEVRAPLLEAGISNEHIDLYLAGVKAYEEGLKSAAMKAAGVEDYAEVQKAVEWAAKNWSPKKIEAFNAQSGDVETVGLAVTALFKDYRGAEPGEGRLTNVTSGTNRGDVYSDRLEFDRDLAKADTARDPLARKAAVAKMERSIKAGSLKKK
jgi:hypothetical protein